MIKGLDHFKNYFKAYSENFIIVGGVATYLLLDEAGASRVRPTKDLDLVLIMKPNSDFLEAIKEYVRLGSYEIQKGNKEEVSFYRFQKPKDDNFPLMIELFATAEAELTLFEGQHIVPVAKDEGIESLSAILLDDEYYSLIKKNGLEKDGIYILNELGLIPFKAKAYLEIKDRGEDSKNWKKHRGDIINLTVSFLTEESREKLTGKVRTHFIVFMEQFKNEITPEIVEGACSQKIETNTVIDLLERVFL